MKKRLRIFILIFPILALSAPIPAEVLDGGLSPDAAGGGFGMFSNKSDDLAAGKDFGMFGGEVPDDLETSEPQTPDPEQFQEDSSVPEETLLSGDALEEVASSKRQWTGITVSEDGRVFVSFPRWSEGLMPFSVGELTENGEVVPYPNERVNQWSGEENPQDRFICAQSVVTDGAGSLWVLDPANPRFEGVVPGGAKLVKISLGTGLIFQVISLEEPVVLPDSYLNDVRVDAERQTAYITDSGNGALIVVDLKSGESRRVLDDHPSTQSEEITLKIDGETWLRPDGSEPRVHVDGIALSPDGEDVYFQALTGRALYTVPAAALRDPSLSGPELASRVQVVKESGPADGIAFGEDGYLYLTAIEDLAIKRLSPEHELEWVVQSPLLQWPDTLASGPDGWMYVTTSQIHLGEDAAQPYKIFRFQP